MKMLINLLKKCGDNDKCSKIKNLNENCKTEAEQTRAPTKNRSRIMEE